MVDFGLKLEDNKVSDWKDHYIQYEKLQSILAKCALAQEKYLEWAAKKPEVARIIADAYRTGLGGTRKSNDNLCSFFESHDDKNALHIPLVPTTTTTIITTPTNIQPSSLSLSASSATTETSIQSSQRNGYGSMHSLESQGLLSRALGKAKHGVSEYFSKAYEQHLLDALQEIDSLCQTFETVLLHDIDVVNSFYNQQLNELESRLQILTESVIESRIAEAAASAPHSPPPSSLDHPVHFKIYPNYLETPLVTSSRKSLYPLELAKRLTRRSVYGNSTLTEEELPLTTNDLYVHGKPVTNQPQHKKDEEEARKVREADSVRRALLNQYRRAKLLQNFAILNYTGFVTIVKKFDKMVPHRKGTFKEAIQSHRICNEGKTVERFAEQLEVHYANWFCDRNVSEARARMLPKKGDSLEMDWSQLRLGYRMGMCCILGLWVFWDCIWGLVSEGQSTIGGRTAFPVFRACGGLLVLQWLWGISVWVWTRHRINYIYLFDFNPHTVSNPLYIFNNAVDNTLVLLSLMLLYYKAGAHAIPGHLPAGVFPFLLALYTIYKLVFPWKIRGPMWQQVSIVVFSPLSTPTLFQIYVTDIFTSMVKVFQDIVWTVGFVVSGDWYLSEDHPELLRHTWSGTLWYTNVLIPLICLIPLWLRFNQCLRLYMDSRSRFPHLVNAFKYAMSQTVTLFGAFHPLYLRTRYETKYFQLFWMCAFISSSLFSFTWDVYIDWGLGRPEHQFLGPRLMYPRRSMYYIIICFDFVLRFAWVLTLVPPKTGADFAVPAYLTSVSMLLELFRRTIWGFLRMEHEHRKRTSSFRRVDFVPLHFTTGHAHSYANAQAHSGGSVLLEVVAITLLVVAACVLSVVEAQHASEGVLH
jgi:xenotropic and polytropic retrovirus receptor 1